VSNVHSFFDPRTKIGRLRKAAYELLLEHERKGELPTNVTFLFYELEQRGVIPKHYPGPRTPRQHVAEATMDLRKAGHIRWDWLTDETRELSEWAFHASMPEALGEAAGTFRSDAWVGDAPLVVCEARGVKAVLASTAYEYLTPITATGGQSGGFIVNEIAPILRGARSVLYIGDCELRGPADQIEDNTRRYIEQHAGRNFDEDTWRKIALTEAQVAADPRLAGQAIEKLDRRYTPPKRYTAVECEAFGQGALVALIRGALDEERARRGLEPIEDVRARDEAAQRDAVRRLARWRR
jgi:hypothetical protein